MPTTWLVDVENKEALDRLEGLGIVAFVPKIPTTPLHVTIQTNMLYEEILRIQGVIGAREPRTVYLD